MDCGLFYNLKYEIKEIRKMRFAVYLGTCAALFAATQAAEIASIAEVPVNLDVDAEAEVETEAEADTEVQADSGVYLELDADAEAEAEAYIQIGLKNAADARAYAESL